MILKREYKKWYNSNIRYWVFKFNNNRYPIRPIWIFLPLGLIVEGALMWLWPALAVLFARAAGIYVVYRILRWLAERIKGKIRARRSQQGVDYNQAWTLSQTKPLSTSLKERSSTPEPPE